MAIKFYLPTLLSFCFPQLGFACAVCFGDPDSQQSKALVVCIFVLLFFIGSVLTLLGLFILRIKKREQKLESQDIKLTWDHSIKKTG